MEFASVMQLSEELRELRLQQEKLIEITSKNSRELEELKERMSSNDTISERTGGSRLSGASVHSGFGGGIPLESTIIPTMSWEDCTETWHGQGNQEQAVRGEKWIQTDESWESWWSHMDSVMWTRKHLSNCLTQQLGKTRGKWTLSYHNSKHNRVFTVTCKTCQNSCTWNYLEDDRADDYAKQLDDMVAFLRLKETQHYNPAQERV